MNLPTIFLVSKGFGYVLLMMIPGFIALIICVYAYLFVTTCEEAIERIKDRSEPLLDN